MDVALTNFRHSFKVWNKLGMSEVSRPEITFRTQWYLCLYQNHRHPQSPTLVFLIYELKCMSLKLLEVFLTHQLFR